MKGNYIAENVKNNFLKINILLASLHGCLDRKLIKKKFMWQQNRMNSAVIPNMLDICIILPRNLFFSSHLFLKRILSKLVSVRVPVICTGQNSYVLIYLFKFHLLPKIFFYLDENYTIFFCFKKNFCI